MKHIFWDWNGTLLDDTQAALDTLNIMLRKRGQPPVALDYYRDHFSFPVRPFYASIGFRLESEDWDALAQEYHDVYAKQSKRLNPEAHAALEWARIAGAHQSVISALRQDLLDSDIVRYGLTGSFAYVYGVDNLNGASKLSRARELALRFPGEDIVVIGDALHDKEVADALNARCVLHGQGSHALWRLACVAETGQTILDAVRLALA